MRNIFFTSNSFSWHRPLRRTLVRPVILFSKTAAIR